MNFNTVMNVMLALMTWLAFSAIMKKFGLWDDKEGKADDANFNANSTVDAFRLMFTPDEIYEIFNTATQPEKDAIWNKFNPRASIYEGMVKDVLDFPKILNDNEELLFNTISKIGSLEEMAWFAKYFFDWVNNNAGYVTWWNWESAKQINVLGDYIGEYLEPSEITRLKDQVKNLKWKYIGKVK